LTTPAEIVGSNIRTARRRAGLTQRELAIRINATRSSIANYEGGLQTPGAVVLMRLAKALSVTPNELLAGFEGGDDE
jgi:transcriptional regulator with XRE-family HTH domain